MNKEDEMMNDKDKILIVNYYALTWWVVALTSGYFKSPEFECMHFEDSFVK